MQTPLSAVARAVAVFLALWHNSLNFQRLKGVSPPTPAMSNLAQSLRELPSHDVSGIRRCIRNYPKAAQEKCDKLEMIAYRPQSSLILIADSGEAPLVCAAIQHAILVTQDEHHVDIHFLFAIRCTTYEVVEHNVFVLLTIDGVWTPGGNCTNSSHSQIQKTPSVNGMDLPLHTYGRLSDSSTSIEPYLTTR